jgi:cytochrome c-type biogenesis protein
MESNATALLAFAAGFLSFVSPCVLPLVPSYMVFITGLSFDQLEHEDKRMRKIAMLHSLAFVVGFSIVFVALGASATALGSFIHQYSGLMMRIGGIVVIFFGLYMAGAFNWGSLDKEKRFHLMAKPQGLLGTGVVGMTFAFGWTPCIGPILGSILLIASTSGSVGTGMYLLGAYAMGLGIPFILAGILFPQFVARLRHVNRYLNIITKISGVLLIVLGLLMVTNQFLYFTGWMGRILPAIDLEYLLPK